MYLNNIFAIIIYFVIYSFFGWIIESVYKSVLQKQLVNSGFLGGPFCPIYGCGALIMYFALYKYKNNYLVLFMTGFIILSIWEYIVSIFLEKIFKTKYWDYSNRKFNINGRVCLKNSIFWGILGCIFILLIHPKVQNLIKSIDTRLIIAISTIAMLYIITDTIITAIKLIKLNNKLISLEKLNSDLRLKVEKARKLHYVRRNIRLTKIKKNVDVLNHGLNNAIKELVDKQSMMSKKIEKQTKRIRKAFPTMKHERLDNIIKNHRNN